MNVLHFYKTYYPDSFGGVEQVIFQLAESMQPLGIQAEVLSLSRQPSSGAQPLGSHLTHTSRTQLELASTPFSLPVLQKFRHLAEQADVIHYHFPWPFMDLVHFWIAPKKPSVLTYHSDIVKQKWLLKAYQPLMHRFLKSMDAIVASSPNYIATSPVLQQHLAKVSAIPFGLDESTYQPASPSQRDFWQQRFGQGFFLFVGALRYYKGLSYLIEAAKKQGLPLVIVGAGSEEQVLHLQAQGADQIHFTGALNDEDKAALLELCSVFVFPSHLRSEAFGISLLEACLFAKPMITCEIGTGTTFVNQHQRTGLVVPPANAQALGEAMRYLWEHPAEAKQMGQQARIRYEQAFRADHMSQAYAALYQSCLDKQRA